MPQEYIITRIKDPDNGNVHWIRDLSAYHESDKGVANGIAELDSNGKVPSSQLPSYVDDVEEYADIAHFPAVGESGKVYIALDTNISYRWGGSTYVKIGSDLSLGETASTAYRGDRGAAAYAAAVTNVETVPTENSGNLITSGAVYTGLDGKADRADTVLDTTLSRGRKANTTVGAGSFAFGNNVEASESYAHAEGVSTVASGIQSHAEGYETVSSGENAHAEGEDTNASGDQAHAEGISTTASGDNSHAEGNTTTASGENAHAEGASATASGENAHAEGEATEASGENTHAEGVETVASNDAAHAEGGYSVASGVYAHAEGYTTAATGAESHAEGYSTTASGRFSHAEGSSVTASGESAHAEGSNAISQGANAHAEGSETQALGESAHAEGIGGRYTDGNGTLRVSSASGKADHTEGYQTSANSGSSRYNYGAHAEGYRTIASNVAAHAEGSLTQATGANSHAEGNSSKAVASQAHAEGTSTYALGDNSHTEGRNSTASGANSHAEGVSTIANHASQHVSGEFNVADPSSASTTQRGVYAEIIGNGASDVSRSNARTLDWSGNERLMGDVYVGCNSDGTGGTKLAKITDVPSEQVLSAKADKVQSAVSGNFASLDSEGNLVDSGHKHSDYLTEHQDISGKLDASEKGAANGVAELDNTGKVPASQLPSYVDDVLEYEDLAHFPVTGESGKVYIAIDTNITYRWGGSTYVAIGSDLALGETENTAYRGDRGAAAYAAAVTNVESSPSSGSGNLITSGGVYTALGDYAPKDNPVFTTAISMGRKTNTTSGANSVALGVNVTASGMYSHAEGAGTTASNLHAHAEGGGTTASGSQAHAEGAETTASNSQAHAEGASTVASGAQSHAEGGSTVASGNQSHAEGQSTTASGQQAHTEGYSTTASGAQSHAEGFGEKSRQITVNGTTYTGTGAYGNASHSEGGTTWAIGDYSHAEGQSTTASGHQSHAEGQSTTASGQQAHAEGYGTIASGNPSHAEGVFTTASGTLSHTEGLNTIANHKSQHVSGEYNVEDASNAQSNERGNYAEIIGNGTAVNARSNARTLDWSGNERLMGDLYVGCNADSTGGTKVAKISDIPSYSDFTGATAQADGAHGFVPAPLIADKDKFLKGDGTWSNCFINGYSVSGNVLTFY